MMQSNEVKDLFQAVSKMQADLKGALKDSKNPFFKSNYADLESCWSACKKPLTENGLCVIQTMDADDRGDYLVTTLAHMSGQWIKSKLRLYPVKNDPQAMGSVITYTRRYALAAIIGLVQTDDDAEVAMRPASNPFGGCNPMQPSPDDGVTGWQGYRIPFGKFKSRTLEEVGAAELANYVLYLEDKAKKDGKQIVGQVAEFISEADKFIGSFEVENFKN